MFPCSSSLLESVHVQGGWPGACCVFSDARESREVGFGIQVTSGLAEAVEICSFGQTVSLVKEDFAGVHKTKALLLYQDNPGAEVHLRVASQDPYLMEKMTASVFHNATRLHEGACARQLVQ